jgi:Membrane protein involved in the export of O-antigen and teichoic acid
MLAVTVPGLEPLAIDAVPPSEKDQATIDADIVAAAGAEATLDRSFARGLAWQGSVKWIVQLVTWATTIFVARILSPEDYGLLAMGSVLLAFIALLSESGIGMTIVAVRHITEEQIAQINGGAVLLGIASFTAACLAAFPVSWFYHSAALPPVIMAMSLTLIISAFRIVPGALLQRDLCFRRLAVLDAGQGLVQALTTVVFAMLGFRYWSLVLSALLGAAVGTAATVISRPYRLKFPQWKTLRPVLPFTRNLVVARLFWYAYENSDFIVAGKRLGSQALGAYSYAWTLASMPVDKVSALVSSVTPPIFAAVQHDLPALRRYFLMVTEGLAVAAFPLTLGLALVARDLVPVAFGDRWLFMTAPLQVLAAYSAVRTITPPVAQVLAVTGDTRFMMYVSALGALVLPTAFYIGSRWGTVGIAAAWAIAHPLAVYLPSNARAFQRLKLPIKDYLRALWPAVSGCLIMAAAVTLVRVSVPMIPTAVRLGLEVLAGAIAYFSCLMLLHRQRVTSFVGIWRHPTV